MTNSILIGKRRGEEILEAFEPREFFELGQDESASPFLTPKARKLSKNLPLKASFFSAFLLFLSYFLSFFTALEPFSLIVLFGCYLIVGIPALIHSIEDIVESREVNIDVLMTLAAFSSFFIGSGFEGALLLVLFALSGAIEEAVTLRAKSSLVAIHSFVPTKAYLVKEGRLAERAVDDIAVGDIILVRAGEVVPLDGVIIEGCAEADFSHLTGESAPVRKEVDDEITSGARLIDSSVTIRVTHKSHDSTVSKIVELITHAHDKKPKIEKTFDRFSRAYALCIISIAALVTAVFPFIFDLPVLGAEGSLYRALAFLITASPCALILAVPIAYLSALSACAKRGIVLKGAISLDALNQSKAIAFDKTGTLTLGTLSFDRIETVDELEISKLELLQSAYALERNAVHPVAKAIVAKCQSDRIEPKKAQDVQVIPGYGVSGIVDEKKCYIGELSYIRKQVDDSLYKQVTEHADRLKKEGKIVTVFLWGDYLALISFTDKPRKGIAEMLSRLKKAGYALFMLTGDSVQNARITAKEIGIDNVRADLKPGDKLREIEELSSKMGLAMCGDGINDAPALMRATCGISMGQASSATARAAADIIFLKDSLDELDWLIFKGKKTKQIVRQNLIIALSAIIFGSIPALYGALALWLAVIIHEGGTVLVGLNALRLIKK